VIPRDVPSDRNDLQALIATFPEVASTSSVRTLRYTEGMPRAWIAHHAILAEREEVASLLASGTVDVRTTAVLEKGPPPLDRPSGLVNEHAEITSYEPSTIEVNVTSDGRGLLVLGETYADGWNAWVDGQQVDVVPVDGVLRGIPVPGGTHAVTLTFESPGLNQGLVIFGATLVIVIAAFGRAVRLDRRVSRSPATTAARSG